jgi:hypothetical protein
MPVVLEPGSIFNWIGPVISADAVFKMSVKGK